jgi:hypothetical protein
MGKYQKPPYYGTLKEAGTEEDLRLDGEDRSSKERAGAGMNCGSWQLIQVERAHREPMFLKEQCTVLLLLLYMLYRTANLQTLHFKYLFNKYPY